MAIKKEEKKQAFMLFVHGGLTLKDISAAINVSQTTLSKWNIEENWDAQKAAQKVTTQNLIQQYYVMLSNINQKIIDNGGIPDSKDADKIYKIQGTIAALDKNYDLGNYYTVLSELLEEINKIKPEDAKLLGNYMLDFIKEKAKQLK